MATLLLATDDAALQMMIEAEVSGDGHSLFSISDGKSAYELALEHEFDLVFLDESLPIHNGFETCTLLREDPDIPAKLPIFLLASERISTRKLESAQATGQFAKKHLAQELRDLIVDHVVNGGVKVQRLAV
jgi:CheY-like chemotaxis protein